MNLKHTINSFLIVSLLVLAGVTVTRAQTVTYTTTTTASGNWSTAINWAGDVAPTGRQAGNIALQGAAGITLTLDVPTIIGQVKDTQGSSRNFTINANAGVPMIFDNTGSTSNNANGDLNSCISSSSSGASVFQPNIIISNTDLEIVQAGSTTPSGVIGILGTSTITAAQPHSLILIQNEAKAGQKVFTINSSIGGAGSSFITISNIGPGTGPFLLAGVVGPNASVVENSITNGFTTGITPSTLELGNSANNYTGPTIITNGTIQLTAANALPSSSTVTIYNTSLEGSGGELLLGGFNDTIGGLNGNGFVVGAVTGTPTETLTVGGGNASGNFIGTISNEVGTLNLAKTGSGTEILCGTNFYSGTTTFGGGFLQAGSADVPGVSGPFGISNSVGAFVFSGGALQYSATNQMDYSSRFSTNAAQLISVDLNGQNITFATPLTSVGGSLSVTDSVGGSTLTLPATETYSGDTTINGGTLALSGSGALASSSTINIGAGGTFNVTGFSSSTYTLGSGAKLGASGYGTSGTTAATIAAASGGFNLGSQGLVLTWNGASSGIDSTNPVLVVSGGTLQFSGNSIDVVVPGTALGVGTYTLISAASISGSPSSTPDYTGGNGVAPGKGGTISVSGNSVILTVSPNGATVSTWTGSGSDNNWTTSANWNNGVPHLAGDSATFGTAVTPVTLNANEILGLLNFTNPGDYTISGANTLTLNNNGVGVAVDITGGTNTIGTPVSLSDSSGSTIITASSGTELSVSGNVSGATTNNTLVINGAGTTALSGNNSYGPASGTVGTTLSGGGTLQVGSNTALGQGDLDVTGNNTLQAGAASLSVTNNIILGLGTAVTVNNNGDNLALDGGISGLPGFTAIGNGKLILNGTNTYSGYTVVDAGVLSISSTSNLAGSAGIILNGGDLLGNGSFTLNSHIGIGPASGITGATALIDATSGQTLIVGGVIASAGNVGVNNLLLNSETSGASEIVLSNANTFNGITIISNGTLDVANSLALQDSTFNYSSGTLAFDSSITAATFGGLTGSETLNLTNLADEAMTLTVGGNGASINFNNITDDGLSGSLTKVGGGAMTITNANYSGNTTVGQGSLTILNGTVGSSSSTITTGNGNGGAVLTITNNTTLTALKLNNGLPGGSTGCAINILGSASANFDFQPGSFLYGVYPASVQLGSSGDTSGAFTIDTTGTVALGNFVDDKDSTATTAATGSGLVLSNGIVTAISVIISDGNSGGNMNIYGGSMTITDTNDPESFVVGASSSARGGFLSMFGGSLTDLGPDGLLLTADAVDAGEFNMQGGVATLTGINLDASGSDNYNVTNELASLSLTGGTLYLGSLGLYNSNPTQSTNIVVLGGGILGAFTNWDASASSVGYIVLTNTATVQAADASGNPWNIELDGLLHGSGNLVKAGGGTLLLTSSETYTGSTTISNGTLALSGTASLASTNIIVGGATFDVSGLSSTFALGTGQTLTGGKATGTVHGALNLGSGLLTLNYTNGTPALAISGALTANNNTVTVNVVGTPLAAGNYTLATYNSAGSAGSLNTTPVITGSGVVAGDAAMVTNSAGIINLVVTTSVIVPGVSPKITSFGLQNQSIVISGTNGVNGGTYYLLSTTNLTLPLNQWTSAATNVVSASGANNAFSFTGTNSVNGLNRFYILSSTNN